MTDLTAQDMNRRVVIQRAQEVDDGAGGRTRVWGEHLTRWAKATPTGGREALVAGTLRDAQGWRVEMWLPLDVTTNDRIVLDGQPLDILSAVDVTGRKRVIVLLCQTAVEP